MHRAQPGNFRLGPRERARKELAKTGASHGGRQMHMQLFTNVKGRRGFCLGRFVFPPLISSKTLGETPHFWAGSVHLKMPLQACILFYVTSSFPAIANGGPT